MRRNKKKKLIAVISASLAVVLVAGIILLAVNAGGAPVKVASVSVINQGYWVCLQSRGPPGTGSRP